MGQDPDTIRHEVEHTRERMGETIDALGYKADVKSRTKERIGGTVEGVKERIGMASDKTADADQVKQGARRAAGVAQENPMGLAVGAMAAGFIAGMLIPSSRVEDEKLGPMADQVKQQAKETGQEALEHGKQVAQSAAETAREEGKQHGEQLAESARENTESARANAGPVSR
jgi:ElaB/YqjD/DUF883 family membrane-anchored ribosome-binding protein